MQFAEVLASNAWVGFVMVAVALMLLFDLVMRTFDGAKKLKKPKEKEDEKRLECDKKFDHDNRVLRRHDEQLSEQQDAIRLLIKSTLALLNHELHNGNSDEMQEAVNDINSYLLGRRV